MFISLIMKGGPIMIPIIALSVFDRVVQVLDVARNAGVERLGIAIEEKTSPTSPNR